MPYSLRALNSVSSSVFTYTYMSIFCQFIVLINKENGKSILYPIFILLTQLLDTNLSCFLRYQNVDMFRMELFV